MLDQDQTNVQNASHKRRDFLKRVSLVGISGVGLALLGGCQTTQSSASSEQMESDADILNLALGLEHEAIGAYGIAAGSGLLDQAVIETALIFVGHHEGHRDALASTVRQLGGTPVEPQSTEYYAGRIGAAELSNQADVLDLAIRLEGIAANAYLSVIPKFQNTDLAKVAGRIAADETMHWTVLTGATGRMIPKEALSFTGEI